MPDARTKPSSRPNLQASRPSSQPPHSVTRLEAALADAEKMARRVDRVLEEDPFAAALLASEYLSLVPELDVNPLNQRGRTDAWTSAFVRLRYAEKLLETHELRVDGQLYLSARSEERRLFTRFGKAPRAKLTAARGEVRRRARQHRALVIVASLSAGGALAAFVTAFVLGSPWLAAGAAAAAIVVVACIAKFDSLARALATATLHAAELERGIAGVAVFETSDSGRGILQRIQQQHPLLVRTSMGEASSAPPPGGGRTSRPD